MKTTIFLLLTSLITFFPSSVSSAEKAEQKGEDKVIYSINIHRLCAKVSDIPYASEVDVSDEKWEEFQNCLEYMKFFVEYE